MLSDTNAELLFTTTNADDDVFKPFPRIETLCIVNWLLSTWHIPLAAFTLAILMFSITILQDTAWSRAAWVELLFPVKLQFSILMVLLLILMKESFFFRFKLSMTLLIFIMWFVDVSSLAKELLSMVRKTVSSNAILFQMQLTVKHLEILTCTLWNSHVPGREWCTSVQVNVGNLPSEILGLFDITTNELKGNRGYFSWKRNKFTLFKALHFGREFKTDKDKSSYHHCPFSVRSVSVSMINVSLCNTPWGDIWPRSQSKVPQGDDVVPHPRKSFPALEMCQVSPGSRWWSHPHSLKHLVLVRNMCADFTCTWFSLFQIMGGKPDKWSMDIQPQHKLL